LEDIELEESLERGRIVAATLNLLSRLSASIPLLKGSWGFCFNGGRYGLLEHSCGAGRVDHPKQPRGSGD